jgi:tripartite-type tricarboxylate transporter receptor subunit TctC
VLADPKFKDKLISQGADPMPGSAEQFGQFLKNEISRWNKIITQAGIVLE